MYKLGLVLELKYYWKIQWHESGVTDSIYTFLSIRIPYWYKMYTVVFHCSVTASSDWDIFCCLRTTKNVKRTEFYLFHYSLIQIKYIKWFRLHHFTLSLPEVCKTEFLLTIWRQYQADKYSENKENDQFMDYKLIQNQILWTDIIKILWQKVRRINDKILGVKGLMQILNSNTQEVLNLMFI